MMRVAIPHWLGRISPVFDVALNALLVDVVRGQERGRMNLVMDTEQPQGRVSLLSRHHVGVLICGAISWPMEMALRSEGIKVIPQICGEVEQVLAAFINGQIGLNSFLMPGCCGRGRQFRRRNRRGRY